MPQFDLISKATKMRKIKDIALFSMIDESCVATVQALFESREYKKGTCILEYDRPVDGLYLLERGEVGVTIPELEGELATLGEGSSFGELTLFNAIDRASATVKVSSDVAQVEFCPRQALMEALKVHPLLAAGFYHGSALLISARHQREDQRGDRQVDQDGENPPRGSIGVRSPGSRTTGIARRRYPHCFYHDGYREEPPGDEAEWRTD